MALSLYLPTFTFLSFWWLLSHQMFPGTPLLTQEIFYRLPFIYWCCQSFDVSCHPSGQKPPKYMIYKWKKQQWGGPCLVWWISLHILLWELMQLHMQHKCSDASELQMQLLLCKPRKTLFTEMTCCSSNLLCTGIYLIWKENGKHYPLTSPRT